MTAQESLAESIILQYWPLLCEQALAHDLSPALVAAVVCQESGGNRYAMRVEAKWQYHNLDLQRPKGIGRDTEWWGQATSWGLMQVMGTVAREKGFAGWWPALCEPDIGLYYGCKVLGGILAAKGKDEVAALLRYNGGGDKQYPGRVLVWKEIVSRVRGDHGPAGAKTN